MIISSSFLELLETYIVVNFRIFRNSRNTYKLTQTLILIIEKEYIELIL